MIVVALRLICALSLAFPSAGASLRAARAVEPTAPPTEAATEAPSPESLEDGMKQAFREHFKQGNLLFHRGAYREAALEFENAYAAVPAAAALSNAEASYERAGDYVAAAYAARRYLALPPCDRPGVDPLQCGSQSDELSKELTRLMARIGELRLEVAQDVTLREIRINGRLTAPADFPILVAPGRVDIDLLGAGAGQRRQRVIEVRAGEKQAIIVDSFDAAVVVPPVGDGGDVGRPPRERGKWLRPTFWAGVGLTAASAVGLATTGALTIVSRRRYEREVDAFNDGECMVGPMKDCYPDAEERRFERYQRGTNVMIGVTAGLAMLTLVVGAVAFTRPRNAGTTRASTRTRLQLHGSGLTLHY